MLGDVNYVQVVFFNCTRSTSDCAYATYTPINTRPYRIGEPWLTTVEY